MVTIISALPLILLSGGCTRSLDEDVVIAASDGNVEQIKSLLKQGANPNAHALDDWTPLTKAASNGHIDAVKLLLVSGARINEAEGGGNTALFWAAFYDRRDVITLLLSDGADINKKSNSTGGETPLHVALRLKHIETAELLQRSGAKE